MIFMTLSLPMILPGERVHPQCHRSANVTSGFPAAERRHPRSPDVGQGVPTRGDAATPRLEPKREKWLSYARGGERGSERMATVRRARERRSGAIAANGFDQSCTNFVRIHVRRRPAILEVPLAGDDGGHRDAHRGAAVEIADAEGVDGRGLVQPGQTLFVVRAVEDDVLVVLLLELLH